MIFTDTSDQGYGGFLLKYLNKKICSAKFKDCKKQANSIHRELFAVRYALVSFGEMLQNQSIQTSIDNSSASRILSVGTKHLQNIAIVQSQNLPVDLNLKSKIKMF